MRRLQRPSCVFASEGLGPAAQHGFRVRHEAESFLERAPIHGKRVGGVRRLQCPSCVFARRNMRLPVYKLKLVRDHWATYPEAPFTRTELAALFFHRLIGQAACEHAAALFLDCRGVPLGATIISIGSLTQISMLGREVYKAAVTANAAGLLLSHNHPSGSPLPSVADLRVTRRLQQAGELLGIRLLDHLIVTPSGGQFTSLREAGLLVGTESTVANSKNSSGPCGPSFSG